MFWNIAPEINVLSFYQQNSEKSANVLRSPPLLNHFATADDFFLFCLARRPFIKYDILCWFSYVPYDRSRLFCILNEHRWKKERGYTSFNRWVKLSRHFLAKAPIWKIYFVPIQRREICPRDKFVNSSTSTRFSRIYILFCQICVSSWIERCVGCSSRDLIIFIIRFTVIAVWHYSAASL